MWGPVRKKMCGAYPLNWINNLVQWAYPQDQNERLNDVRDFRLGSGLISKYINR